MSAPSPPTPVASVGAKRPAEDEPRPAPTNVDARPPIRHWRATTKIAVAPRSGAKVPTGPPPIPLPAAPPTSANISGPNPAEPAAALTQYVGAAAGTRIDDGDDGCGILCRN